MSRGCRPQAPSENRRFLASDELALLESLVAPLAELITQDDPGLKRDPASHPRSLATLILHLQVFMDTHLGETSPPGGRFMVKLPASCLRDFAHPNGAVRHVLEWSLHYKLSNVASPQFELLPRRFDLLSEKSRAFSTELCKMLSERLKAEGHWSPPKVFFWGAAENAFEELGRLKEIVVKHGGTVVERIEDSTHIVLSVNVIDPADRENYFRVVERRGNRVFAHWWYYPDSYDVWLPSTSSGGGGSLGSLKIENVALPPDGRWKVGVEWLLRLERFNEWMNEGDFEVKKLPSDLIKRCGSLAQINPATPDPGSESDDSTYGSITAPLKRKRGRPPGRRSTFDGASVGSSAARKRARTAMEGEESISTPVQSAAGDFAAPTTTDNGAEERQARPRRRAALEAASRFRSETTTSSPTVSLVDGADEKFPLSELIPAGVVKHPPRSHSIAAGEGEATRAFGRIRNLQPFCDDQHAVKETGTKLAAMLVRREAAARTVLNLWASTLKADLRYCVGLNPNAEEVPDVPPVTGDGVDIPAWLRSTDAHLSDFERQSLEDDDGPVVSKSCTPRDPTLLPIWFSFDCVHPIEKQFLATIFPMSSSDDESGGGSDHSGNAEMGTRPEEAYKVIRNAMINRYQQDPHRYLSFSDCRRFIDGDAALLLRIFSVLEYWQLINPSSHVSPCRRLGARKKAETAPRVLVTSRTKLDSNLLENAYKRCLVCDRVCLYLYYTPRAPDLPQMTPEVAQRAIWCARCFADGKFPEFLAQHQFLKVIPPFLEGEEGWTEKELEKLIEGVELYGEEWNEVARHVGAERLGPRDCVQQFLSLSLDGPPLPSSATAPAPFVFETAANPVLEEVKLLRSVLGPQITHIMCRVLCDFVRRSNGHDESPLTQADDRAREAVETSLRAAAAASSSEVAREDERIRTLLEQLNDLERRCIDVKLRRVESAQNVLDRHIEATESQARDAEAQKAEAFARLGQLLQGTQRKSEELRRLQQRQIFASSEMGLPQAL